ncbi:hypothetical protein NI381_06180 [Vibrio parahaemolyticus]|nr:hypothetical protein [Vibrio parahaemolyticus]WMN92851.1 hypothetical protein NI381_06180 [Vibrio parahaemolyticus]
MLTYDNADYIKSLYSENRQFIFNLNYSAAVKRKGTELLVVSKGLKIYKELNLEKAA